LNGSRALVAAALVVAVALAGAAAAEPASPLRATRAGVAIDWSEGRLAATGGAAADLRMPSADVARPGSLRRARAAAVAKLRAALEELPLGGGRKLAASAIDRALAQARTGGVTYQSNGGALVEVTLRFADWIEAPPAAADAGAPPPPPVEVAPVAVLSVPAMPLGAAPLVKLHGAEVATGAAHYRLGPAPASAKALAARVDKAGRLTVDGGTELGQKLARGVVLIYVGKVQS
jgi:hypothetical protein